MDNVKSYGYCGDLVRRYDPDRFLMTMMMPAEKREALWALFAFNYEIARTREVVTETTLGLIRLQWWRDALAAVYDDGTIMQNEILPGLAQAIHTFRLPREMFDRMLYAREFDLEDVVPASLAGMEAYADFTHTPLVMLALHILGGKPDEQAVRPCAVAYSLTGLLRAVPFHAMQRRCFLPADLLAEAEVSERSLYECKPGGDFTGVVCAVADRASVLNREGAGHGFLKAMRVVTGLYLGQIRGAGGDVFRLPPDMKPAFFHLRFLLKYSL